MIRLEKEFDRQINARFLTADLSYLDSYVMG